MADRKEPIKLCQLQSLPMQSFSKTNVRASLLLADNSRWNEAVPLNPPLENGSKYLQDGSTSPEEAHLTLYPQDQAGDGRLQAVDSFPHNQSEIMSDQQIVDSMLLDMPDPLGLSKPSFMEHH